MTGRLQFATKCLLPTIPVIERLPHDAREIARYFHIAALQSANAVASQPADEITQLKKHILPRTRFERTTVCTSFIIRREEDDRKANIAIGFHLFDYSPAPARLLVENDWNEFNVAQETRNCFAHFTVVSMNDEDLV